MVDNQNINARYLDKFGSGTTSVRTNAPPGGHSTFSLGWGNDTTPEPTKKTGKYSCNNYSSNNESQGFKKLSNNSMPQDNVNTSVKVKQTPGGKSSIKFG